MNLQAKHENYSKPDISCEISFSLITFSMYNLVITGVCPHFIEG